MVDSDDNGDDDDDDDDEARKRRGWRTGDEEARRTFPSVPSSMSGGRGMDSDDDDDDDEARQHSKTHWKNLASPVTFPMGSGDGPDCQYRTVSRRR